MKYKAVLYDLDDTLIKSNQVYKKAQDYAAEYIIKKYSLDREPFLSLLDEKHLVVSRNFPNVHTRHSRILVFKLALEETVIKYDLSLLPVIEDIYWDYFLENIQLFPNVESTLAKIRDSNIKLAIVSDGSLSLRIKKVKAAGLLHYFDQVIASEEVIFEKPFSAIFTLALSRLEIDASHAVMVGNNYKNDIRGAQMVGIYSGIYNPEKDANIEGQDGTIVADFEISDHADIFATLES